MAGFERPSGRAPEELRDMKVTPGFIETADGSVLFEIGGTRVICTASVTNGVPAWRRGSGSGWLTAEYSLLPGSTSERSAREASRGRQGGRTLEIQRLIGRSLRSIIDLRVIGERTVYVDCDVIQADGGTRCASVSGGYLALYAALRGMVDGGNLSTVPLSDSVAAVSVGVVQGEPLLDLDYAEDVRADVDMNVVMTGDGRLIEVQATAEQVAFGREAMDTMLDLADSGIREIAGLQADTIARAYLPMRR